jgi:poly(3-hydroxybutyrate) depolymerase
MLTLLWTIGCVRPDTCDSDGLSVRCPHQTTTLHAAGMARDVLWQVPDGDPPEAGWPAAVLFQGSGFPAGTFWSAVRGTPLVPQVELTTALLDAGFVVVTPKALGEGLTCWNTNLPPWAGDWDRSPDAALMDALFAGLADGSFGPVDDHWLFAAGISSGGYMTSRMAITWPERFAAVSVVAGSYATCAGPVCRVPDDAPLEGHPPTLFLHGKLDAVVPIGTMRKYRDRLDEAGIATESEERPRGVHAWPPDVAQTLPDWFVRYGP